MVVFLPASSTSPSNASWPSRTMPRPRRNDELGLVVIGELSRWERARACRAVLRRPTGSLGYCGCCDGLSKSAVFLTRARYTVRAKGGSALGARGCARRARDVLRRSGTNQVGNGRRGGLSAVLGIEPERVDIDGLNAAC